MSVEGLAMAKKKKRKSRFWEPFGGIKNHDERDTEVSRKYMVADRLRELAPKSDRQIKSRIAK